MSPVRPARSDCSIFCSLFPLSALSRILCSMTTPQTTEGPTEVTRGPTDEELDIFGLTHTGKVRKSNQDHFLIASLRRQVEIHLTSLPDDTHWPPPSGSRSWPWSPMASAAPRRAKRPAASPSSVSPITSPIASRPTTPPTETRTPRSPMPWPTPPCRSTPRSSSTPTTTMRSAAWPPPSPCGSVYGRAHISCRWETAAVTSCVTTS